MTREKVIEGLEYLITAYAFHGEDDECLGEAVELLKEQEPVEPDKPEEVWLCGNCGEIVGWDDWVISTDDVRHKYCPGCGRKAKWDAVD